MFAAETSARVLRVENCTQNDPLGWRIRHNRATHSQFLCQVLAFNVLFAILSVVSVFWRHLLQQPSPGLSERKNNREGHRAHLSVASLWVLCAHPLMHFSVTILLHSQWVALVKSFLLSFPAFEVTFCSVESIWEESWVTGGGMEAGHVYVFITLRRVTGVIWLSDLVTYSSFITLRIQTAQILYAADHDRKDPHCGGFCLIWARFCQGVHNQAEENKDTSSVLFGSGSQHVHETERTVTLSGKCCRRRTRSRLFKRPPEESEASRRIAEPSPLVFVVVGNQTRWVLCVFFSSAAYEYWSFFSVRFELVCRGVHKYPARSRIASIALLQSRKCHL